MLPERFCDIGKPADRSQNELARILFCGGNDRVDRTDVIGINAHRLVVLAGNGVYKLVARLFKAEKRKYPIDGHAFARVNGSGRVTSF